MAIHDITKEIRADVAKVIQGREMEKAWDNFMTAVQDAVANDVAFPFEAEDEDDAVFDIYDYAQGKVIEQYGMQLVNFAKAVDNTEAV